MSSAPKLEINHSLGQNSRKRKDMYIIHVSYTMQNYIAPSVIIKKNQALPQHECTTHLLPMAMDFLYIYVYIASLLNFCFMAGEV